ncbi:MAG: hypothetical protein M1839_004547 [Geoglossum umbratile]|nr:MAG: hypothetical protein M1839_004547 [Geoglossum umbratile]
MAPTSPERQLDIAELHHIRKAILRFSDVVASDIERNEFEATRPGLGAKVMLYIWQCPMMLMAYSWITFALALTLYICTPFITHQPWGDGQKIAIFYLVSAGLVLTNFIWTSAYAYNIPLESQTSANASRQEVPESGVDGEDPEKRHHNSERMV